MASGWKPEDRGFEPQHSQATLDPRWPQQIKFNTLEYLQ